MFGPDFDGEPEHVIVPPTTLTLAPGRVVFITGGSGGDGVLDGEGDGV